MAAASFVARIPPITAADMKAPKDSIDCLEILPSSDNKKLLSFFFIFGIITVIYYPIKILIYKTYENIDKIIVAVVAYRYCYRQVIAGGS